MLRRVTIMAVLLGLAGCASDDGYRVVLTQDAVVTTPGNAPASAKKGDTVALDQPTEIEAPGHVGVLVVPVGRGSGDLDVKLKPITAWGGPALEKQENTVLNELVAGLVDVQRQLAERQPQPALMALTRLQTKYPHVTFLNFLKASCLVMLGQKPQAVEALEAALADFPDHPAGRALYRSLVGRDYQKVEPGGAVAH